MVKGLKPTTALFFLGSLGGLWCVLEYSRTLEATWLFGVAVAATWLTWSITDAILATRRDVREWRKTATLESSPAEQSPILKEASPASKPLRQNSYFRAGVMGLPFCLFEWFWKHEVVFLLGSGFFAGVLIPSAYARWQWIRIHKVERS